MSEYPGNREVPRMERNSAGLHGTLERSGSGFRLLGRDPWLQSEYTLAKHRDKYPPSCTVEGFPNMPLNPEL